MKKKYGDNWTAHRKAYVFGDIVVTNEGVYKLKDFELIPLKDYIKSLDQSEKPAEDLTGSDQE